MLRAGGQGNMQIQLPHNASLPLNQIIVMPAVSVLRRSPANGPGKRNRAAVAVLQAEEARPLLQAKLLAGSPGRPSALRFEDAALRGVDSQVIDIGRGDNAV